jgi:hypothetical protein
MLENNFAFAVIQSNYPHVGHMLQIQWAEPDFPAVIDGLLNPDQSREGLTP